MITSTLSILIALTGNANAQSVDIQVDGLVMVLSTELLQEVGHNELPTERCEPGTIPATQGSIKAFMSLADGETQAGKQEMLAFQRAIAAYPDPDADVVHMAFAVNDGQNDDSTGYARIYCVAPGDVTVPREYVDRADDELRISIEEVRAIANEANDRSRRNTAAINSLGWQVANNGAAINDLGDQVETNTGSIHALQGQEWVHFMAGGSMSLASREYGQFGLGGSVDAAFFIGDPEKIKFVQIEGSLGFDAGGYNTAATLSPGLFLGDRRVAVAANLGGYMVRPGFDAGEDELQVDYQSWRLGARAGLPFGDNLLGVSSLDFGRGIGGEMDPGYSSFFKLGLRYVW